MSLQRQHFLLSYFKTLSVGPVEVWTCDLSHGNWANRSAVDRYSNTDYHIRVNALIIKATLQSTAASRACTKIHESTSASCVHELNLLTPLRDCNRCLTLSHWPSTACQSAQFEQRVSKKMERFTPVVVVISQKAFPFKGFSVCRLM